MKDYRSVSLWFDQLGSTSVRPASELPKDVDVAIVGAGFTGLWTAYYLQQADPTLSIALLEAEVAGFGASGRNGGWCSALYPVSVTTLAAEVGRDAAIAQYRAMQASVIEVERVVAAENIAADFARGGTIVLARTPTQLARAQQSASEAARFGMDLQLLDADTARARLNATDVLGATFTPHCAAIHPARLVRGLAETVERRGARICEHTRVSGIEPHLVHTDRGDVRADTIVRATEGFTARLPGTRRALAPVYSLMIATAPLPQTTWDEIGLRERETFSDHRHLIIYGQRSADGRLVFGGRGAPYHFGSRIRSEYDHVPRVFAALERTIEELLPMLRGVPITHRWGGPIGIARDWHPSVGLERATGIAWAGGYVGDGVSTTNLAGRTLADLITDQTSELTSLPWVGHHSRKWEPEPLRWLGVNAGLGATTWADHAENRSGKPSRLATVLNTMLSR